MTNSFSIDLKCPEFGKMESEYSIIKTTHLIYICHNRFVYRMLLVYGVNRSRLYLIP